MDERTPEHRPELRAADEDRDRAAERLAGALEEGRLSLTEYDQRLQQAMTAKTMGELERLVSDLPVPKSELRKQEQALAEQRKLQARRELLTKWKTWFGFAVLFNVIWLVTSIASGWEVPYWPIFPMGIWAAVNVISMLGGGRESGRSDSSC